jgi:hypothetical protein
VLIGGFTDPVRTAQLNLEHGMQVRCNVQQVDEPSSGTLGSFVALSGGISGIKCDGPKDGKVQKGSDGMLMQAHVERRKWRSG